MTVAAAYPQPPWFAGGTRLGGTLALPGAGGRSLELRAAAGQPLFPAETAMAKVSGDSTLTVSGSTVTGGVRNPPPGASSPTDSNGTIRLYGVLSSVTFSATTNFIDPTRPDGIYLQVGALVPAADTGRPG
jgi:hypothetical protein